MDLALESDIYQPSINADGNYVDYLPPSSKFASGMRCPCGARKEHVFNTHQAFAIHCKSKTHQKWIEHMNSCKFNYAVECTRLKDTVASQKLVIARLEKELSLKIRTIDYLSQQLMVKDTTHVPSSITHTDLLTFD